MRHYVKLAALGLVLIAPLTTTFAASKSPKLARCDGKSRRPANPYGSILPSVDPVRGTVVPAPARPGGVDIFPQADRAKPGQRGSPPADDKAAPQIPPISAISPPTSFGSC